MLEILKQCQKEIIEFPEEIRGDLADAISRLEAGHNLSLPLSRPMPSIGKGVHELRLKNRSGAYRVIYAIFRSNKITLVHAFKKTTEQTPRVALETAKGRLKNL